MPPCPPQACPRELAKAKLRARSCQSRDLASPGRTPAAHPSTDLEDRVQCRHLHPKEDRESPSAFLPLTPRGVPRCPLSTSDSTAGLTQLKTLEAPLASPPTPLLPLLRAWIFPSAQRGKWVSIQ